jgi:hypothetical protein
MPERLRERAIADQISVVQDWEELADGEAFPAVHTDVQATLLRSVEMHFPEVAILEKVSVNNDSREIIGAQVAAGVFFHVALCQTRP